VIFVWYSKMIKSVEEGKEKLENAEENSIIFDLTPLESLRRKLNKEDNFNFFNKKIDSSLRNITIPKKGSFLENSHLQSEKETIKSAVLKRKEEINNMVKSMGNLIEFTENEDFLLKESERGSYRNFEKEISPLKLIKREKVYINRRNIYYDKDGKFSGFCFIRKMKSVFRRIFQKLKLLIFNEKINNFKFFEEFRFFRIKPLISQ